VDRLLRRDAVRVVGAGHRDTPEELKEIGNEIR
jgi:hypothetical protein